MDLRPDLLGEAVLHEEGEVRQVRVEESGIHRAGLVNRRWPGEDVPEGSWRGRTGAQLEHARGAAWGASFRGRSWRSLTPAGLQSPCGLLCLADLTVVGLGVRGDGQRFQLMW